MASISAAAPGNSADAVVLEDSQPLAVSSGDATPSRMRRPDASNRPESERSMTVVGLAFVTYLAVSGGPFGIETAVGAAGPLPTIIGIVALAVLWELPQALMTAELSTLFPSNAGYIGWVSRGLGPFWGYVNAGNSLASNLFDLPLYPVLIADYAAQVFDVEAGGVVSWCVKGGALAVVLALNLLGVEVVATSSVVFTLLIIAPFVVQMFLIEFKPQNWTYTAPEIEWVPFVSATLWAVQGFDSMGCVAGEVKNSARTYPIGISLATLLITANYLIPVMVGVSVMDDFSAWRADDDDTTITSNPGINLATVGKAIAPWMGVWVLVSATLANLAEFSAIMTTSSRALQHVADYGMLPACIARTTTQKQTPVVAIILQAVIAAGLMNFDFSQLVILDTLFNNMSLLLEVASFLYLKHRFPKLSRPYAVPWGIWGAWIVSIPKLAVIVSATAVLLLSDSGLVQLGVGFGCNLVFMAAGWYWVSYTEAGKAWAPVVGAKDDADGATLGHDSSTTEVTSLLGGVSSSVGYGAGTESLSDTHAKNIAVPGVAMPPLDVGPEPGTNGTADGPHRRRLIDGGSETPTHGLAHSLSGSDLASGIDDFDAATSDKAATDDDGISLPPWDE